MSGACLVCTSPNLYRGERCQSCYRYWREHGQDRAAPKRVTSIENRNEARHAWAEEIRFLWRVASGA